jgi:hypothetical protein
VSGSQDQRDRDPHGEQYAEAEPFQRRVAEIAGVAVPSTQQADAGAVYVLVEGAHGRVTTTSLTPAAMPPAGVENAKRHQEPEVGTPAGLSLT